MSEPTTADEVAAGWRPPLVRARVCLDGGLALAIERAEDAHRAAVAGDAASNRDPRAPAAADDLARLRADAQACEVEFVFRALGRQQLSDMVRAHPPTEAQRALASTPLEWDEETFPPALLAAACVSPPGTTPQWWRRAYDEWADGQVGHLFAAAFTAQRSGTGGPKG